jgi:hypothetical protein
MTQSDNFYVTKKEHQTPSSNNGLNTKNQINIILNKYYLKYA